MSGYEMRPEVVSVVARSLAKRTDLTEERILHLFESTSFIAWSPSPIEEAFWYALHEYAHACEAAEIVSTGAVGEPLRGWTKSDRVDDWRTRYLVEREVVFGNFRADFVITTERNVSMVVECDGADWHTKPDQVARDKARDRAIVACGLPVIRFTGSEIYRDAIGCAESAIKTLDNLASAQHVARNKLVASRVNGST